MESRKSELLGELNEIRSKEIESKLIKEEEIGSSMEAVLSAKESKAHHFIMKGDFILKFLIATSISVAFMYSAIIGVQSETKTMGESGSGFAVLSILGPLFGAMLQYYFGKNKAGSNGE